MLFTGLPEGYIGLFQRLVLVVTDAAFDLYRVEKAREVMAIGLYIVNHAALSV